MFINYAFLKSPGSELLNIGPIYIRWYGFLISFALFFGLFLSKKLAKSRGINPEYINKLLPSLVFSLSLALEFTTLFLNIDYSVEIIFLLLFIS